MKIFGTYNFQPFVPDTNNRYDGINVRLNWIDLSFSLDELMPGWGRASVLIDTDNSAIKIVQDEDSGNKIVRGRLFSSVGRKMPRCRYYLCDADASGLTFTTERPAQLLRPKVVLQRVSAFIRELN